MVLAAPPVRFDCTSEYHTLKGRLEITRWRSNNIATSIIANNGRPHFWEIAVSGSTSVQIAKMGNNTVFTLLLKRLEGMQVNFHVANAMLNTGIQH
jgi:hypothetical protein